MTERAWLGIDVGTSSLKVLAVGVDGRTLAQQELALPLDHPAPGRAEADPRSWTRAVDAVALPLAEQLDVAGVGVTGQMHGTVLLDADGQPVRPAVLWPDSRAGALRSRWEELPGPVLGRLGNPWSPGMTGPVLAWLARHEPEVLARAGRVALPKDFVREHLVPSAVTTDPSDASGTLLWDVVDGAWSTAADGLVEARLLPPVTASDAVVGTWRGAEVVVGGGDTPVSLLALEHAVGGWQPGDVVLNLGTGAQVIDPRAERPSHSGWPGIHTYSDVAGGRYAMVAAQNAGLALSWAQGRLGLTWDELADAARRTPAGANGLLFRPFVSSERGALVPREPGRGPGWLGAISGAISGPTDPPVGEAARAAVEAQAFLVRRSWELLDAECRRLLVVGGGAREAWVRQLLADVLGRPVHHLRVRSASAAGAVVLAGGPMLGGSGTGVHEITEPRPAAALDSAYVDWCAELYG